jgi:prepilin-type processing-associated H-X9-DG protein
MYTETNNNSFMVGWNGGTMWMTDLLPYYQDVGDIRLCPVARKFLYEAEDIWAAGTFTAWGTEDQYGSYGINAWIHNPLDHGVPGTYDTPENMRPLYWRKSTAVKRPDMVPAFGGCMWDGAGPTSLDAPPVVKGVQMPGSGMSVFCLDRHRGYVNFSFLDGTVRKVGLKELWQLQWHKGYIAPKRMRWPDWMTGYK